MHVRSNTEKNYCRYTLAHGRVILYGQETAVFMSGRHHKNAATLNRICSKIRARLRQDLAGVCRRVFEGLRNNPAHSALEGLATSGRQLSPAVQGRHDKPVKCDATAQRYERTTARTPSIVNVSEIVRDALSRCGPSIRAAVEEHLRSSGDFAFRTSDVSFYARRKPHLRRNGKRRFDPSKHPRVSAGHPNGGEFVEANGGTSPDASEVIGADDKIAAPNEEYDELQDVGVGYQQILLADSHFPSLALQLAVASLAQTPHRHHIFAREFGDIIKEVFHQGDSGFSIDDFITRVDKEIAHKAADEGLKNGLRSIGQSASNGGYWNSNLKVLVKSPAFEKLTAQQQRKAILENILQASRELEYDLTDLTKWGKDSLEDNAKSLVKFLKLCAEADVDQKEYGKQMGKLVAKCLQTEVGRKVIMNEGPEVIARCVKGGIKGMIKNGANAALKKSFGPLSAFLISMAMQNGDVEAALLDSVGIPPVAMEQLKGMARGDSKFDFGTLGSEEVESAGTLKVGRPAEVSVDGRKAGYVRVVKILDAGGGWYYVTIVGEKDRFLQLKVRPSDTNTVALPDGFPYHRYLPELRVPDPVIR